MNYLAFQGEEDEIEVTNNTNSKEGKSSSSNNKESATLRAVRELRKEALDRLRSGEHVHSVVDARGSRNNGAGEGKLVIHREADLLKSSITAASNAASGGGAIVLAGAGGGKASSAASASAESGGEGKTVRPGGILVVRLFLLFRVCILK